MLIGFGAVQAGDAAKDQEKLQGSWQAAEIIRYGKAAPADEVKRSKLTIAADKMTLVSPLDADKREFRIKLNPATKPKAIDLTFLVGQTEGTIVAIYQLEADMLKLCLSNDPAAKERPSEFASKEGTKLLVYTFKRVKP
jgi:uncharacterized protein (TIGR03067 family)